MCTMLNLSSTLKLLTIALALLPLITTISSSSSSFVQVYINGVYDVESSCILGTINLTHCSSHAIGTSYICPDLDSSLEYISNATQYGNINVAHVCLPSGYFTLTTPRHLNVSVTLTGLINQSIIRCDYDSNKNIATSEDELQFTLFFSGVSFVRFDCVQFESCPQPLRITLVEDVMISNSRFERFSEGVFDIFNSNSITIVNSSFIDNYSTGTVLLPFRGNTGAVAVGYDNDEPLPAVDPLISVDHCMFVNNSADVSVESMVTSTNVIATGVFTGRGGGLGLFIRDSIRNVSASISDSEFRDNYASSFGGGIYVGLDGDANQHNVTAQDCLFVTNRANLGAGGMIFVFFSNGLHTRPMTATALNCKFIGNSAETGGGIYIFPEYIVGGEGNLALVENCTFDENEASLFGGALATAIYSLFQTRHLLPLHHIINCTFTRNRCVDGIVNIGYVPFALKGKNVFTSNSGPALRIIASLVQIHDEVWFIDNETPEGGALYINSFGQIQMFSNSSMTFERNRGQIGASIVVSTQTFPSVFNKLINNPQCFLLYQDGGLPFSKIHDLSLQFNNNTALEASAIFLTSAQQCSWIGNTPPYFDAKSLLNWPIINNSQMITPDIETTVDKITIANHTVSGRPGEVLSISIKLVDETSQIASEFLQLRLKDQNNQPTTKYRIQPTFLYQKSKNKLNITYAIKESVQRDLIDVNATTTITIEEFFVGNAESSVILNATRCLAGSRLAYHSELGGLTCQCNTDLEYIRNCEDDQRTILLTDGLWGIEQAHDVDENLVVYPCPSGYCRCFLQHNSLGDVCSFAYFNGNPDRQCVCERKGYLCGDCRDGKGVSALLNHCVDCSNAYGILIGVLVIIDGILIVILLIKNVGFSALLFPTIFFINMISYVGENFPTSYDKVGRYMYYLNSFLSLYFPYDFCLYSGTTALASFTFRYIPLSLSIIVCSIVVTWFRYSAMNTRKIPWDSLWLLLTLQYSHVIYTSMTILNCPHVVNENGEFESRWFINGTHDCFTGRHTLLGLWAIIVLLVCLALVPFLALVSVGKIKKPHWISQLSKCLKKPFKEELPYWCAVELGRKFVLVLFLIPFPQNTCPPLLILMATLALYAYMMPYKDMIVNVTELVFQLDFILFLLLRSTQSIVDDYLVFPHEGSDSISKISRECSDNVGIAILTWLLLPFTYVPLVIVAVIVLMILIKRMWRFCQSSKGAAIVRNYSRIIRRPTYHTSATDTRHFTFGFQDGVFQNVTKAETSPDKVNNEESIDSAAAKSGAVDDNTENACKL